MCHPFLSTRACLLVPFSFILFYFIFCDETFGRGDESVTLLISSEIRISSEQVEALHLLFAGFGHWSLDPGATRRREERMAFAGRPVTLSLLLGTGWPFSFSRILARLTHAMFMFPMLKVVFPKRRTQ